MLAFSLYSFPLSFFLYRMVDVVRGVGPRCEDDVDVLGVVGHLHTFISTYRREKE
jgi:hypothetical protein